MPRAPLDHVDHQPHRRIDREAPLLLSDVLLEDVGLDRARQLLGADAAPLAAWMFLKAFPVRWATADLSARDDQVLIDTLELCYASMQALRI